ncbi:DUF3397 domain-containing protein [Bacillus sp. DTU_2020_1000418_1_SI_GHA_SEK_038]|uniref:DUF3397 domain-containing protein n=1 Tax=Bacillus sp. DTU_2020_1000418_1_SI_GHA_SEK_038 TaxID=3077585 RepID=UPI0028E8B457|nr:DUF3397 domain-containing protein [Bacillus sp. DTU_2020_1000418_1_SI_GHA_SEK_038]WNS77071.1 DUF3397 domain-containing protein [Bacillus sp. DTU_2020_1000418_1_SI_GHA_SEK_038]
MISFFSSIIATFVTIPLLGYFLVFIICKQVTKQHKKSVHMALDVSTFLFIISVHYLILAIWEQSFLWVIFLSLLVLAIIFVLLHWKIKHEINLPLVFRGFWRFNFLLFFTAYVVLTVIGLIQSVSGFVAGG